MWSANEQDLMTETDFDDSLTTVQTFGHVPGGYIISSGMSARRTDQLSPLATHKGNTGGQVHRRSLVALPDLCNFVLPALFFPLAPILPILFHPRFLS